MSEAVETAPPPAGAATTPAPEVGISVEALTKHFRRKNGEPVTAVDGVTLEIPRGEFWVLLGPSGCGKTTLLRCIAGLERPDSGELALGDRVVFSRDRKIAVPTEQRGIGMVFQAYALWPHMNVRANVAFPLTTSGRVRRLKRSEIRQRVQEALDLVGIGDLIDQPVSQLSGGQQQRVSLARAIVGGNDVILFDEPLSNVDAKVREQLRVEIRTLQRTLGFTALYVTHDQEEAMELADRIAVLSNGQVAQLGTADEIYNAPASRYVAEFVGVANVLEGSLSRSDGTTVVRTAIGDVEVSGAGAATHEGDVVVVSRAHRWWVSASAVEGRRNAWKGTVETQAYVGSHVQVLVQVGPCLLKVWADIEQLSVTPGSEVWVGVEPSACLVMDDV